MYTTDNVVAEGKEAVLENSAKFGGTVINTANEILEGSPYRDKIGALIDERYGLGIKDPHERACVVHLLNNTVREEINRQQSQGGLPMLSETVSRSDVSGFVDQLFPIVRASFNDLILPQIVSTQPLRRPSGTIFYMDYVVGRSKGKYIKGQRLFSHRKGYSAITDYTSENVTDAVLGTGDGATATYTFTLTAPVRPYSFTLSTTIAVVGAVTVVDDGAGSLTAAAGLASGSIDYETGVVTMTFTNNVNNGVDLVSSYRVNYEMNEDLPEIAVLLLNTTIQTRKHVLRYSFGTDAGYDYQQEFGRSLNQDIIAGLAETISTEVTYSVLSELWDMAGAAAVTFSLTVPPGITRTEHYKDLTYAINQIGLVMFGQTQKIHKPTFGVCSIAAAAVLKTIPAPTFKAVQVPRNVKGAHKIGTLMDGIDIFVDPLLHTLPGASAQGDILFGYKGNSLLDSGFIYAPYQMAYMTPVEEKADFMKRQAMASRFGTKRINSAFYKRLSLIP